MKEINNYIGKKIGENLTVIGIDPNNHHFNSNHWIFRCSCGKEFSDIPARILSGHKQSCGCKRYTGKTTHNCANDPFYHTWCAMMWRCYKTDHHNYPRYGARGICVCDEWHDPKKFIEWAHSTLGEKDNSLTLDRIDNDGPYSPENCRWATVKEQARNRRTNRYEVIDGETKAFVEWCEIYNIEPSLARSRVKIGWSVEDAIKTKPNSRNPHPAIIKPKKPAKSHIAKNHIMVELNGETKNISQWCDFSQYAI